MKKNPNLHRSLLADPESIAVCELEEAVPGGVLMVVAPHPDDESLACGGLIALARESGREVRVVIVSDGSASHLNSRMYPAAALAELRRGEALAALEILRVGEGETSFLELPDGKVPHDWDEGFEKAVARMAEVIEEVDPDTIFTPWRRDVHHDHIATTSIVTEARKRILHEIRVVEYPVWVWEADSHDKAPTSGEMRAWRLDVRSVLGRKKAAIAAHASQMTDLISDDPAGFVMNDTQLARFTDGYEIFFEPAEAAEDETLGSGYFEGMYVREEDPWEFATSEYEAAKYKETLVSLGRENYGRVLELGCSIGVFTEMLAGRSEALLAVDASGTAVGRARDRCKGLENVVVRAGFLPREWPEGIFDLIVISEVAYYLSRADLEILFDRVVESLPAGGEVLMVHWTPFVASYPQTGDEVHDYALGRLDLKRVGGRRAETYRIDVFEKAMSSP
ncbi:PIG-L family deacetylase [Luteolibacter sp. AS25]|uniref:PIG-L family deacetylase n=1 Tax=Luteolibacter sp. AS25 TaxID=3135776 RepID=UPI00398B18F3